MSKINIGIEIDLDKLISSRLLIQASSGGGKSYAIRKLAEACMGQVQVIIIDIEGEFVTLREKFPFVLVSKEGEIPLNIKYAETLAHKLLETNLSAIIDLSEMEVYQRRIFVKRFAHALIESPKHLWHPCVVIIDEADFYAPQGKDSESTNAVINLSSRGRKRGICPVYATQRIAKLHKDVTADVLNKIIGLTGQDIDQQRAGSELGFTNKQDIIGLRKLLPGEFYGYGPAISNEVIKFKVSKTITSHMEAGKYKQVAPPTPAAIKKILSKLESIPDEAEKELNTKQQLQDEVKRLNIELKKKSALVAPVQDTKNYREELTRTKSELIGERNFSASLSKILTINNSQLNKAMAILSGISVSKLPEKEVAKIPIHTEVSPVAVQLRQSGYPPINDKPRPISGGSGEMRILKAAAMFHPNPISRTRIGAFARLSHTSGSFGTYISSLRTSGYLIGGPQEFTITEEGLAAAGDVPSLPTDPQELINLWCGIIGESSGAARMLRVLGNSYPNEITRQELGEQVNMSSASGSFGTYLSYLSGRGLIKKQGQSIKASDELFL